MTAVPDVKRRTVQLICDGCGHSRHVYDTLNDAEVVWPLLTSDGWSGSPFATGPHWCPTCGGPAAAPPARVPVREDRGTTTPSRVSVRQLRDVTLVTLSGSVHHTDPEGVRMALATAVSAGRHVLVDLTTIDALDAACLSTLVKAYGDAKLHGYALCLITPSKAVRVVLHTMRLDRAISVFDKQADAMTWLAAAARRDGAVDMAAN